MITPAAFPATSTLDKFNWPLGWLGSDWAGSKSGYLMWLLKLNVNSGGVITWKDSSYGANQEAFVTLKDIDSDATHTSLLLKVQSSGSTSGGAMEVHLDADANVVQVWTYDATNGWVQRGSDISATYADGNVLGARVTSSGVVTVYKNGTSVGTVDASDWSYATSTGYIGLWMDGSAAVIDSFGGGTVSGTTGLVSPLGNKAMATLTQADGDYPVTITYTYDGLDRLIAADYSNGVYFHYTYDAVGNRLSEESFLGTTTYSYDSANRLASVDDQAYTCLSWPIRPG